MKSEFIEAGKIINTHGIAGALKVDVWLDSPAFMKKFKRIFIGAEKKEAAVVSASVQKNFLLVKLEGIEDVNAAMALKEKPVFIAREDASLPKGSYFLCDILGAEVRDETGCVIGVLEEIMENPAQPIYVVKGEREVLIPAVPEFIKAVDPDAGVVTVRLIPGL